MSKKIKVIQNDENPIPIEVMAESIKAISDGVKKLLQGRLNEKAIVLLIQHAAPTICGPYGKVNKVGTTEIRAVLQGMESLESTYLKKKPNKA